MTDLNEILITSEASGSLWTCCAWDPKAGTNLMTYKGGGAANPHALSFIKNEFIITGDSSKPLLHIWPVNSQEQIQGTRLVTTAKVSSLAISPDGNYCVASSGEYIYIWQICSGRLLATLSLHYQNVTSLKFIDDGSHFVSAGIDGKVLVWNLGLSITQSNHHQVAPLYTFSDHALPVTDVHIGKGALRAYLVSVSLDRTCRIYDLSSGTQLLNLVFQESLSSVTMDHLDTKVYCGSTEGNIFEFNLQAPPRMREYHLNADDSKKKFSGHKGHVTCLSISLDGMSLVSGGVDENVILWHIPSKQVIQTLSHKGSITNAFFTLAPKCMFEPETPLHLIVNNFKRMTDKSEDTNQVVEIMVDQCDTTGNDVTDREYVCQIQPQGISEGVSETLSELEQLREENRILKRKNKQLYEYGVKKILNFK